uniref:Elongation factor-like 1 n=1 Tax=Cacopsylla melanoneura TaxID=428564 RepID=A0A8D8WZ89_9HEMI
MAIKHVSIDQLSCLQYNADNIRNICILAHVDHGKTTLADCLISSNGIISSKMAGKLRYMDSRKDEQERGITMKSSSISLYYKSENSGSAKIYSEEVTHSESVSRGSQSNEYLINLIDSPGHVDFSSEVSTAVRLCDGAIIVVDCVEGVCAQTQVALRQAWLERIQPILVLNKIDRLILEMKLSPLDIYVHLSQLLEQVNAVMGELFASTVMTETADKTRQSDETKTSSDTQALYTDWATGLEDADDSDLYFSPDRGNVVFASAYDGWGFTLDDFVRLYSARLGIREPILRKTLWGDYYLNMKAKRIMKGAQEKAKTPLFVELVLKNVHALYETVAVRKDKEKLVKIVDSLGVKLTLRDLRHTDSRVQIQAVMSQWLPLSSAVLRMIVTHCPAPNKLSSTKVEKLLSTSHVPYAKLPPESKHLKTAFLECSPGGQGPGDLAVPLIVFVSKMFPVDRKQLPENRTRPLTREEMTARREAAKERLAAKAQLATSQESHSSSPSDPIQTNSNNPIEPGTPDQADDEQPTVQEPEDAFIAFARVYSGTVKKGDTVYVLGPKHNPSDLVDRLGTAEQEHSLAQELEGNTLKDLKQGCHVTRVTLNRLYMLMGRELCELDQVPAGNMLGIGGLEEHVLKSATLSSCVACPSFSELHLMATPILRVALEPVHPGDLATLVRGLRLLNQADACVEVVLQESGEHVLVTAGEVHLQRCLDDLRERYAKVEISVSEPIVPFRETIITPPLVDMTNESIVIENKDEESPEDHQWVCVHTQDNSYRFRIQAVPLPEKLVQVLDRNMNILKQCHTDTGATRKTSNIEHSLTALSISEVKQQACSSHVEEWNIVKDMLRIRTELRSILRDEPVDYLTETDIDRIVSFGPKYCGPNILINCLPDLDHCVWPDSSSSNPHSSSCKDDRLEQWSTVINGFQMASLAGPLCEEPMMGVGFKLLEWSRNEAPAAVNNTFHGPISGQIMATVKEGCRKAFQTQPQRLMVAMYTCNIQVSSEVLGKLYAVLGRRHGRIVYGDVTQGSDTFTVQAYLPVVESFSFAPEIRKSTSGLASPQLVFSHWEVIPIDPYWEPRTEEEYLHFGDKADSENRARKYMDNVRRRKGLRVQEKLVAHAEKQRTVKRNK